MSDGQPVLIRRVLTVLIILPLFLAALFWLPQSVWGGVMLLVVIAACFEWSRLVVLSAPARIVFVLVVAAACVGLGLVPEAAAGALLLGAAVLFWIAVVPLWLRRTGPVSAPGLTAAGAIVLVSAWYSLFVLQPSGGRLLALLAVVWIADTSAYFAGRRFGRRKLAPLISPGKTWEGVLGAIVGVGVYYALLWLVLDPAFLEADRWLDLVLVAAMTVLSIEGDLFESWVKRRAGVKDSGSILPGHGGVLDRIDGVVAALPLAALAAVVLRG